MTNYDIVIIGAGPGGSAAAITAARAGMEVLILERTKFPRHRPGETLHPGIEPLLVKLGVFETIQKANYLRHSGIWIDWKTPIHFQPFGEDEKGVWLGFQALRDDFDARLLSVAEALGVEIQQDITVKDVLVENGCVIGVITKDKIIKAKFIFDAGGASHFLARRLKIPINTHSPKLLALYGYCQGEYPNRDLAPLLRENSSGWVWTACVAPKLYQWTRLYLQAREVDFNWRPKEFNGLTDFNKAQIADVTWRIANNTAGEGFFLIGDAAVVLDPVSSHGVLRAIMSGMMAAHLVTTNIKQAISEMTIIKSYETWLTSWFAHDLEKLTGFYQGLLP